MTSGLAGFAIALAITVLLIFPLGGALRKRAWVFYLVAFLVTVLFVGATWGGASLAQLRFITVIFQKGYLASLLLGVVMFTGCLDESSALRHKLQPNRGHLSILSFIFVLGHLAMYLPAYLPRLEIYFSARGNIAASLVVAMVLTILFAILTLTSVKAVRAFMGAKSWKALQRTSYIMVLLFAVHIGFVLGRSAFNGGTSALVSFTAYVALVVLYVILRVRKAVKDSASRKQLQREDT